MAAEFSMSLSCVYTGPEYACGLELFNWPRVMEVVVLIANAESRISDKYPAVSRLSDVAGARRFWRYATGAVGADREYAGQLLVRPQPSRVMTLGCRLLTWVQMHMEMRG